MMTTAIVAVLCQGSISTDPRLAIPMSFDSSLVPLSEMVRNISTMTSVVLSLDPSLEYLKVDAFLDNQPACVTLSKLSEAFDLTWEAKNNGYRLVRTKQSTDDLLSYLSDEDKLVNKTVDKDVRIYQLINSLVPRTKEEWKTGVNRFASWKHRRDAAKEELDAAKAIGQSVDQIWDLEVKFEALDKISEGSPNLELARLFGGMSQQAMADYRDGLAFVASNGEQAIFSYSKGDIRPNPDIQKEGPIRSVLITRIDPGSKRVGTKEFTFVGRSLATRAEPASHYPFDDVTPTLAKRPFAKRLIEWDQTRSLAKEFTDRVDGDSDLINGWKSPWFGNRFRLGDHLRWFHLVTGVPVIAPADRTIHPFLKPFRRSSNQGDYLTKLISACKGFGHKSDDFLLVRDGAYWRKSLAEIPESTFAQLETKNKASRTLKDYATFATNISRAQAMIVQDPIGYVVRFPRYSFAETYPVLQFVDTLSRDQMIASKAPAGLSFDQLGDNQQNLFTAGIIEGIVDRGLVSEGMLDNLMRVGLSYRALHSMKFHISTMNLTTIYEAVVGMDEERPIELLPKIWLPKRSTVKFQFGYDANTNVSFLTEDK